LKDHELPEDMLPESWAGFAAHSLVSQMYGQLAESSNRYITATLQNAQGSLPCVDDVFWQRFK
ncbi:MAG: hypothetical protein MJK04_31455, partial [Psychrosphaera sp.]|nr:hypothetical protein [Psychrosphaera sp.]